MPDYYHVPALAITALLLPAFGYLYLRFRDIRTLLWFLGFIFALGHMLLFYHLGLWNVGGTWQPWISATGQMCAVLSSSMFLGSLSPLSFRLGRRRVLYVVPFALPLLIYSFLAIGVFKNKAPQGALFLIFPALGLISLAAVLFWDYAKGSLPIWVGYAASFVFGGLAFRFLLNGDLLRPLMMVDAGNHIVAALLLVFVYRRFSPGLFLSTLGFVGWSLPIVIAAPFVAHDPSLRLDLIRVIALSKVVCAVGMILLTLEHELDANKAAEERERRARVELEAYTSLILSRRRLEDFDHQGTEICETVASHSRFSQVALLLLGSAGRYRVVGSAGMEPAVVTALDALAARIPVAGFLAAGSAPPAVEHCQTLRLSLEPWFRPGDDLDRLQFTRCLAVPLSGRTAADGALLLAGMRRYRCDQDGEFNCPLRPDDLLPIEILAARLQSVRSQTMMLEKLIDSEKFAGLGQLAANVTQQLNNPLTVILGYASLLEGASDQDQQRGQGIEAILAEARRMKSTLESLARVSWSQGDRPSAVSITELLSDLEELHRNDYLHRSIHFETRIAPDLPRALCHARQIRQAVLHCLHYAAESVENSGTAAKSEAKTIRIEAAAEGNFVQIVVAHSGLEFQDPERAFDPFVAPLFNGETTALGLSLCATILRDNNGRARAMNLEPRGAAIVLELQSA